MEARAKGFLCSRGRYYRDTGVPIILSALGAFAAFSTGSLPFLFIGVMLLGQTFALLCRWRTYDDWLHNKFFPGGLNGDLRRIRLEIADDGLREIQGDIVAFAPWKAVSETILSNDLLVIKLSSTQEALIPRRSFGISELNLEEIRTEIDRRRIAHPASAGAALPTAGVS